MSSGRRRFTESCLFELTVQFRRFVRLVGSSSGVARWTVPDAFAELLLPGWYLPDLSQPQVELDSFDIVEGFTLEAEPPGDPERRLPGL